jgi:hypothetical protein
MSSADTPDNPNRVGGENDAAMMQALLSGYVFAGLQNLKDVLARPIEWETCDTDGLVAFTLASGMHVDVQITVTPVDVADTMSKLGMTPLNMHGDENDV